MVWSLRNVKVPGIVGGSGCGADFRGSFGKGRTPAREGYSTSRTGGSARPATEGQCLNPSEAFIADRWPVIGFAVNDIFEVDLGMPDFIGDGEF